MTRSGVPDLLVCMNGWFCGIELKAEHGKAEAVQYRCLEAIRDAGGTAILLYPKDFTVFKEFTRWVMLGDDPKNLMDNPAYKGFLKDWQEEWNKKKKELNYAKEKGN